MRGPETRVIGYFAYTSPMEVVCTDVDACIVSGSFGAMRKYVAELDPQNLSRTTIKKTRFGEILQGMQLGAAYAFDEESYARFYPLAADAGLAVQPADFEEQRRHGNRFLTVRPVMR